MSKAEGIGEIMKRLGLEAAEVAKEEEKRRRYAEEYGLLRKPSGYEIARIEEIERAKRYCERCGGLRECQYSGGDRGLEAVIMVNDVGGRLAGNRLYFGVKECRYLLKEEEERKVEAMREGSGLPEVHKRKRKYELRGEEREVVDRLLKGESKQLYIKGNYRESEELLSIIGNEYVRIGLKVRYENALELLSEMRVTSPKYHEKMEEVKAAGVLIIEGLPCVMSRYNDEQIGIILNYRNRRGKRSVVNGEGDKEGIGGVTGEQLRIYEELRISKR